MKRIPECPNYPIKGSVLCNRINASFNKSCIIQQKLHRNCGLHADFYGEISKRHALPGYAWIPFPSSTRSKRGTAMLNQFKIALSLALVLGSASAAFAAHKHPPRAQNRVVHARTASPGSSAYGFDPAYRPSETRPGDYDQYYHQLLREYDKYYHQPIGD
jgi:hypothetical protein